MVERADKFENGYIGLHWWHFNASDVLQFLFQYRWWSHGPFAEQNLI